MSRIGSHPLLFLALVLVWLLLTSFTLGHLLLGTLIALAACWAFGGLEQEPTGLRRILPLIRLGLIVGGDIIRSNIAVARLIVTNDRAGQRHSGFVRIPLRLTNRAGLALLSICVTATPGTAWLQYDPESGILLLHVFDLIDEAAWQDLIRNRYEALLLEAFE